MTPVERTTTSSAASPSASPSPPLFLRVSDPGFAGGRVRDAGVHDDRLRLGHLEVARETATGAACTRFVVQTAPPTAGGTERTSATSSPDPRIPAALRSPRTPSPP